MVAAGEILGMSLDAESSIKPLIDTQALLYASTSLTQLGDISDIDNSVEEVTETQNTKLDLNPYKKNFEDAVKVIKSAEHQFKEYIDSLKVKLPDVNDSERLLKKKQKDFDSAHEARERYELEISKHEARAAEVNKELKSARSEGYNASLKTIDASLQDVKGELLSLNAKYKEYEAYGQEGSLDLLVTNIINESLDVFAKQEDKSKDSLRRSIFSKLSMLDDLGDEALAKELQMVIIKESLHVNAKKKLGRAEQSSIKIKTDAVLAKVSQSLVSDISDKRAAEVSLENQKFNLLSNGEDKFVNPHIENLANELSFTNEAMHGSELKIARLVAEETKAKKALESFKAKIEQDKASNQEADKVLLSYDALKTNLAKSPSVKPVNYNEAVIIEDPGLQSFEDRIKLGRGDLSNILKGLKLGDDPLSDSINIMIYLDQLVGAKYQLLKASNKSNKEYVALNDKSESVKEASLHLKMFEVKIGLFEKFGAEHKIDIKSKSALSEAKANLMSNYQELMRLHENLQKLSEMDSMEAFDSQITEIEEKGRQISAKIADVIEFQNEQEGLEKHSTLLGALALAIEEFKAQQDDEGAISDFREDLEESMEPDWVQTHSFSEEGEKLSDILDDSAFESELDGDAEVRTLTPQSSTSSLDSLNALDLSAELSDIGFDPEELAQKSRVPSPTLHASQQVTIDETDDESDPEETKKKPKFKKRHKRGQSLTHDDWSKLVPSLLPRDQLTIAEDDGDADDEEEITTSTNTRVRFNDQLEIFTIPTEPESIPQARIDEARLATDAVVGSNDAVDSINDAASRLPQASITEARLATDAIVGSNDEVDSINDAASRLPQARIDEARLANDAMVGSNDAVDSINDPASRLPQARIDEARLANDAMVGSNDEVWVLDTNEVLMSDAEVQTEAMNNNAVQSMIVPNTPNTQLAAINTPLNAINIAANGSVEDIINPVEVDESLDISPRHVAGNNNVGMVQVSLSNVIDVPIHHNDRVPEASVHDPAIENLKQHMNVVEHANINNNPLSHTNEFAGKVFSNLMDEGSRLSQNIPLAKVDLDAINHIKAKDEVINKLLDFLRRQRRTAGMLPDLAMPPAA